MFTAAPKIIYFAVSFYVIYLNSMKKSVFTELLSPSLKKSSSVLLKVLQCKIHFLQYSQ